MHDLAVYVTSCYPCFVPYNSDDSYIDHHNSPLFSFLMLLHLSLASFPFNPSANVFVFGEFKDH